MASNRIEPEILRPNSARSRGYMKTINFETSWQERFGRALANWHCRNNPSTGLTGENNLDNHKADVNCGDPQ